MNLSDRPSDMKLRGQKTMNKYPRAQKFLADHPGWTIDQCIASLEKEAEKI